MSLLANRRARRGRKMSMRNIVASCNSTGLKLSRTFQVIIGAQPLTEVRSRPSRGEVVMQRIADKPRLSREPRELFRDSRPRRPDAPWRIWSDALTRMAATA